MSRGRTTAPRSSSPFAFPIQLPVLHPPRLLKRQPSNPHKATTSSPTAPADSNMAPIRNRRRRSTVTLPDVENSDAAPQFHAKRQTVAAPLPLSPRTLNMELPRTAAGSVKCAAVEKWKEERYMGFATSDAPAPGRMLLQSLDESIPMEPPALANIFCSPRSPTLELSFDDGLPTAAPQNDHPGTELYDGRGNLVYLGACPAETEFEDFTTQLEEITVRTARSRAQQRERAARRWESLCNSRIRFLKEQGIQASIYAEMVAAATRPPVANPTFFNVFGASPSTSASSPASPSPFASHGAPLTRVSPAQPLPSPYMACGETLDLGAIASTSGRDELEAFCDPISSDQRPLVDRMIEYLDEFEYEEISVDGLTEAECRQLRNVSRKRRRLERQRAYELGMLLELKRRQIGRSRSSSASSSDSSVSSTSSDSDNEQPTSPPPMLCAAVQTVDHLIAKMLLKRRETAQRQFTSSVVAREVFEARGCSSLRVPVFPVLQAKTKLKVAPVMARRRSHSTKPAFSDFFSLSGGAFGLGGSAWLKEKRRLTSLDLE